MDGDTSKETNASDISGDNMEISGYSFKGRSDYERALKEYDTVEKLKLNINPDSIENIKNVYLKLTSKNYFTTPVGISFLHEMQKYLEENGEQVPLVPVPRVRADVISKDDKHSYEEELQNAVKENQKSKTIRNRLIIAVVALAITVIAMIFMVMTNDNLGYYNAQEKVLDKYSSWEEELDKREKELNEREEKLNIQENQYK